jgi:hypothetical protein
MANFFLNRRLFGFFKYVSQHCFICRPSNSTVSENVGIKPRNFATLALAVSLLSNHSARSHPQSARSREIKLNGKKLVNSFYVSGSYFLRWGTESLEWINSQVFVWIIPVLSAVLQIWIRGCSIVKFNFVTCQKTKQ